MDVYLLFLPFVYRFSYVPHRRGGKIHGAIGAGLLASSILRLCPEQYENLYTARRNKNYYYLHQHLLFTLISISNVYVFTFSETTTNRLCRVGQSKPRCLTRALSLSSPDDLNLANLRQLIPSSEARVSCFITIDCQYRYRSLDAFFVVLLLSQSIAIVHRLSAFVTAMGLPPLILPLYYVGVYGDDECCYYNVICLSLASLCWKREDRRRRGSVV